MRPQKYAHVAERFAQRIRKGDYHLHELPAERELAAEAGVSYTTARKAVQSLVNQGLLYRQPNGRAAVRPVEDGGERVAPAQIALLTPAWESSTITRWRAALARSCSCLGASCRTVLFAHWDDPTIPNTIQGFDGTFLIPEPEPPTESLLGMLRQCARPIVVLGSDWSRHGLRSVMLDPAVLIHGVLDHLASLGHRTIDCFNVQPAKNDHIMQWRLWCAAQHLTGELINDPVTPYEDPSPAAYAAIEGRLRAGQFQSKALYCTTEPAAIGAMAALIDHGLQPGRDVAVCTSDSGSYAAFGNPSLTAMADIAREPFISVCLDWMLGRLESSWPGPLLLQPADCHVVVRQSTVPGIKDPRRLT